MNGGAREDEQAVEDAPPVGPSLPEVQGDGPSTIEGGSVGDGERSSREGDETRARPTVRFSDGVLRMSGSEPEGDGPFDVNAHWRERASGTMSLQAKEGGGYTGHGTLPLSIAGYDDLPFGLYAEVDGTAVTGHVTPGRSGNAALAARTLFDHADTFGWSALDALRGGELVNDFREGRLELGVKDFAFGLGSWVSGTASFGVSIAQATRVTFAAKADVEVPGLDKAEVELSLDDEKVLRGRASIAASWKKFSGTLDLEVEDSRITGEGTATYTDDKLTGTVHLLLTDKATADSLARSHILPGTENGEGEAPASPPAPSPDAVAPPAEINDPALAGWGELDFAFTEWFTGKVKVIVDGKGDVTTVGEIAPPAEIELFPQRDWVKKLFQLEVRARYGLPVIGNIFVFANVGMDAVAKLGPGKIYNIKVIGQFSTDSTISNALSLQASLNISAFAGLRLRAEGGAGLEVLGHDVKIGAGVNALAGVRGYVEATPTIGYRDQGGEPQFYLAGVLDLAAQPFLELSGDLFVELDSPWWSPAPDKKWTWPLGSIDYPLPGEIALRAQVEHVLGSKTAPEIEFSDPGFDGNKFFTDLVNDHVPPARGDAEGEKQGEWHEEGEGGAAGQQGAPGGGGAASGQGPAGAGQAGPGTGQSSNGAGQSSNGAGQSSNGAGQQPGGNGRSSNGAGQQAGGSGPASGSQEEGGAPSTTVSNGPRVGFETDDGDAHSVYVDVRNGVPSLMIASTPRDYDGFVTWLSAQRAGLEGDRAATVRRIERELKSIRDAVVPTADEITTRSEAQRVAHAAEQALEAIEGGADGPPPPSVIKYGDTGPGGYGTSMSALLTKVGPGGSVPTASNDNWEALKIRRSGGSTYYIRGHLLNHNVHGTGARMSNLTPLTRSANKSHSSQVEETVKSKVDALEATEGGHQMVRYTVRPVYSPQVSPNGAAPEAVQAIQRAEAAVPRALSCQAEVVDVPGSSPPSVGGTYPATPLVAPRSISNAIETEPSAYQLDVERDKVLALPPGKSSVDEALRTDTSSLEAPAYEISENKRAKIKALLGKGDKLIRDVQDISRFDGIGPTTAAKLFEKGFAAVEP